MQLTFRTSNEDETVTLGVTLARVLRPGDVVALDGELGAGKTRLVRGIAEGIGADPGMVASPTYVVVHEYPNRDLLGPPLVHVDAYRLQGPEDLDSLGWDLVMDGTGVVVVEWAERIAAALAQEPSLARVLIERIGENDRRLTLLAPPSWRDRSGWQSLAALVEAPEGGAAGNAGPADRCRVCGRKIDPDGALSPFCSDRCRQADLGKWLTGSYLVSREIAEQDLDDPDLQRPSAPDG